jgi:hypothetical protein
MFFKEFFLLKSLNGKNIRSKMFYLQSLNGISKEKAEGSQGG